LRGKDPPLRYHLMPAPIRLNLLTSLSPYQCHACLARLRDPHQVRPSDAGTPLRTSTVVGVLWPDRFELRLARSSRSSFSAVFGARLAPRPTGSQIQASIAVPERTEAFLRTFVAILCAAGAVLMWVGAFSPTFGRGNPYAGLAIVLFMLAVLGGIIVATRRAFPGDAVLLRDFVVRELEASQGSVPD
jgi:hypothetical protein